MAAKLYVDVHVKSAITRGLRLRGVDVLTAQEDAADRLPDAALLDRVEALGRMIFTRDDDFLGEAVQRQRTQQPFASVIYAHQQRVAIGPCVRDLELIAKTFEPDDRHGHVLYLPL